jgi:hypothetical protein
MNRSIIIILFSVWYCFVQPATGAHAQQDPKTPPYALNGAGVLNASNCSITQHSLKIDNKKINYTAIAASITVRGEQSEPIGGFCRSRRGFETSLKPQSRHAGLHSAWRIRFGNSLLCIRNCDIEPYSAYSFIEEKIT